MVFLERCIYAQKLRPIFELIIKNTSKSNIYKIEGKNNVDILPGNCILKLSRGDQTPHKWSKGKLY